jgi:cystathionine beta-lyase
LKNNFNKVIDRTGTDNFKWDKLMERYGKDDLLPFWIADSEYKTDKNIISALIERVEHGIFGYSFKSDSYLESIVEWYKRRHETYIEKSWITSSPGIMTAVTIAIESFTSKTDSIITFSPSYPCFYEKTHKTGRNLIVSNLYLKNGKYNVDFKDFEERIIAKRPKMLLFCNPHNPSGRVWNRKEIEKIGNICFKYGIMIISDDIHCDIVYSQSKYLPLIKLSDQFKEITIMCSAPSKTFNIAGLATSVIIIPNENIRNIFNDALDKYDLSDGNVLGNVALEAAYTHGDQWLDNLLIHLEDNRNFVVDYFLDSNIEIYPIVPEGSFMMLLDMRALNMTDEDMKNFLIYKAGVLLNQGDTFGDNTESFVRFNFSCSRETLKEGLNRIAGICSK